MHDSPILSEIHQTLSPIVFTESKLVITSNTSLTIIHNIFVESIISTYNLQFTLMSYYFSLYKFSSMQHRFDSIFRDDYPLPKH